MNLTVARHPQPAVVKGLCYGHLDVPLAHGWEEATHELAEQLNDAFDVILTSDLSRCSQAAKLIKAVKYPTLPLLETSGLRELHFGTWEGRAWDDISPEESMYWTEDLDNQAPPGGEYKHQFKDRVDRSLASCLEQEHQTALVFCHAGVIRYLYERSSDVSYAASLTISVPYLSLHHFNCTMTDSNLICYSARQATPSHH
jgi:alpha-ribazole phosphatase